MKIVVTIPTYNESETIGTVIDQVMEEAKKVQKHDIFMLIVDGNSPDGTAEIVRKKSTKYPNVKLLMEDEKKGLGAAYIYGFKHAINVMDADVLIEMDGDLQHKPEDVVKLIAEIDSGADYVIGSRFIEGGSIPEDWAFYRKFLSKYGSLFTKMVLGIKSVTDYTSGFKATRVKGFMDKLDLNEITSSGFSYKMELLYKLNKMGAKIKEIPIEFGKRDKGASKMELKNFMESLWLVMNLRAQDSRAFLTFLAVGAIGFFVDAFVFNIVVFMGSVGAIIIRTIDVPLGSIASLISGFIAMTVTYILNNKWTFEDRKIEETQHIAGSILIYYISSYLPILLRSWLVKFSVETFGDTIIINNGAFLLGIVIGLIWNFTVYNRIIWREKKENID